MKDEILKVINDNSVPKHFCEYGEGVFADINAVDEIAKSVVKLFSIHIVSQQRELLEAFVKQLKEDNELTEEITFQDINKCIASNCG